MNRLHKFISLLFIIISLIVGGCFLSMALLPRLPTFAGFKDQYQLSDWVLLDRKGRILQESRQDFNRRRPAWIPLAQISPSLIKAVLHSEDKRFKDHFGVDWISVAKNSFNFLRRHGRAHGASTITMQLVSHPKSSRRTLKEKFQQILQAMQLELGIFCVSWKKEEILEAYLNVVSFRGELQGIASASWGLMKKHPQGLTLNESIVLASLIPGPNAPREKIARRANLLAQAFQSGHFELPSLLPPYVIPRSIQHAPQAALHIRIKNINKNLKTFPAQVSSTLDFDLQVLAKDLLDQHLSQLQTQNVKDGAVLVVENSTGNVLAYVGNGGPSRSSRSHVDGVIAKRLAGSTLKPFLYAQGIEDKIITAASLILDSPLNISLPAGIFSPQNYDHQYRGIVTIREALASSLNIPAVKALGLVGTGTFIQTLKKLHISGVKEATYYGPSLALGGIEVSLWEMVNAYRVLINKGHWSPLNLIPRKPDPAEVALKRDQVFSASSAFIITDILSDREARAGTFSLESPLNTSFWTAVKTGTSKDMRDNWCLGVSEKFTVGVWVGNFSGESMWNVSGISGAAPLWASLMRALHHKLPSRKPAIPKTGPLIKVANEYFLDSTTPPPSQNNFSPAERMVSPKILYPPSGLVVALDPDIPLERQRIPFQTTVDISKAGMDWQWQLNEKIFTLKDNKKIYWTPIRGHYKLFLQGPMMENGKRIIHDHVAFMVR